MKLLLIIGVTVAFLAFFSLDTKATTKLTNNISRKSLSFRKA